MMLLESILCFQNTIKSSLTVQRQLPTVSIWFFLIVIMVFCGCEKRGPASANAQTLIETQQTQSTKKVLVLHSYHYEYEWVRAINRGISMVLAFRPEVDLQYFYMDTKHRTDSAWKEQIKTEALDLINEWQPDVIIATDDNAQDLVGRQIAKQGKPALVFCGVNQEPQEYGYPTENVTGVLERLHLIESLELFKQIQPDAQKVLFISDYSPTSEGVIDYCKSLMSENKTGIEIVDWIMPKTFDQWKQTILDYNDSVDAFAVYTYHTVKESDTSAVSIDSKKVIQWTVERSRVPIIGFLLFSADDGASCGVFESGTEQGKLAAEMALEILDGAKPETLPIVTANKEQTAINLKMIEKYHLEIPNSVMSKDNLLIHYQESDTSKK